jgi:hypothetical protein
VQPEIESGRDRDALPLQFENVLTSSRYARTLQDDIAGNERLSSSAISNERGVVHALDVINDDELGDAA